MQLKRLCSLIGKEVIYLLKTRTKARVLLLTVIKMKGSGSCEMKEKGFIFPQTDFRSLIL